MAFEYHDGIDALRSLIEARGISRQWSEDNSGKHTFRSQRKGTLHYWPHRGTVQCKGKDGPDGPKAELEAVFSLGEEDFIPPVTSVLKDQKTKIFVVHGHDTQALEQLELVLRRLGLNPYILQNNDGESKTLIEALEQQIYLSSRSIRKPPSALCC